MNSSKSGALETSWFRGIVLSLSLHAIIILLAIFWGFSSPKQSGEAQSIEGTLVSPSEFEQSLKGNTPSEKNLGAEERIKAPQPPKTEIPQEPKKAEVKEEPPKIKVEKPKKAELKKEEPPPKIEEEKPRDVIALETKKKKQVAEIPKPTEQPRVEKPRKPSFEDVRNKVLEEMKKREVKNKVLEDIQREAERKSIINELAQRTAEANPSNGEREIGGGGSGSSNRQSPGARAALAALFINRVREEIKNSWGIPENIPRDGSLKTVVVFRIDEGGRVHDVRVEKSSGNPAFDDFCVKAIYRASPLTPPPSELLEEAKTDGVEVPFTNDRS